MKFKKYPKYKDSGIEWIGEIPEHWEIKRLKFTTYFDNSTVDRHIHDDEIKVTISHYPQVYNNEIINSKTIMENGTCTKKELEKFRLKKNDVLITKDSETPDDIGVPAYVNEDLDNSVSGYHIAHLTSNQYVLFGEYLFRYLQTKFAKSYFETEANGITRYGLGKDSISNIFLTLPKIEEQKQIAEFLDKQTKRIDSEIEKNQKLIELLKEKRQSTINQAVTKGLDPSVPMKDSGIEWIGEIPEHWNSKRLKFSILLRSDKSNYSNSLQYVGLENITSKTGKLIDVNDDMSDSDAKLFEEKDILFGKLRPYLAKVWHAEFAGRCSSEFLVFKGIDYESKFLSWLLLSDGVINNIDASTYGAKMPRAEWGFIANILLPILSINEQQQIAEFLEKQTTKIDSLITKTESQIEKLKEFRQSLISSAVTGKIDVSSA